MYLKNRNKFDFVLPFVIFLASIQLLSFFSCKKHTIDPTYSKAKINLVLTVDGVNVEWDTIKYTNAAGNPFAVSSMNLFLSGIKLKKSDGTYYSSTKVIYIDPSVSSKSVISLDSIPPANYVAIEFYLGVDPSHNISYALENTTDNVNMAWPDPMGGGYHFMKFEGYYLDSLGIKKGYAIHLGKNENLISVAINAAMHQQYWNHEYTLNFNVSEVFKNPYTYNLNTETNYTMSDSLAMQKIKNNCSDAFTISQNN